MSEVYYTTVYCTTIKLELIYLLVYIYRIHLQNECVILWNIDTMTVAHSKYTIILYQIVNIPFISCLIDIVDKHCCSYMLMINSH